VKRNQHRLAWLIASVALSACGGGTVQTTQTGPASVGGIWRGEMMAPSGVALPTFILVTEDGRFFSVAVHSDNVCADVAQGTLISATGQIGVQIDCAFSDGSVSGTAALSGSFVPRSTLTLTSADTTSLGTPLQAEVGTLTFDNVYNEASSISQLEGRWILTSGVLLTIASDGTLSSVDGGTGCVMNGKVSLIDARYNAYALSATYSDCQPSASAFNGLTATGLMSLDNTQDANVLYLGYSMTLAGGEVVVIVSNSTH
jgi:hypothetical protein